METGLSLAPAPPPKPSGPLWDKAVELEATFLSEMLAHSGLDAADGFASGTAEGQFSSFLRDEQARLMARKGGIGLAEHLFRALSEGAEHGG